MAATQFASVGLSFASAASWGAGDFTGGIAAKRTGVFGLVVAAHGTGFLAVLVLTLAATGALIFKIPATLTGLPIGFVSPGPA